MKLVKTIAMLLIAASLFGCVDTPDSLKESQTEPSDSNTAVLSLEDYEDSASAENTSAKVNETVERGSLAAIRNQLETDLKKTYKNISVSYARVSNADAMPTYNIKIGINPNYDFDKIIGFLYEDKYDVKDENNFSHIKAGDVRNPNYPAYKEPTYIESEKAVLTINVYPMDIDAFKPKKADDITLSTYMYSLGNIWGSQSGGGDGKNIKPWYNFESCDIYKTYDLYNELPDKNESYTMADGKEWNTVEAIEYVEYFWNEYIAPSDPQVYIYSVKTLWIIDLGDDKFGYLFSVQRQDENGNYFDVDFTDYYFVDKDVIPNEEPFIYTNRLYTYCAQKEVLTRFTKDYSFSLEEKTDEGNDLLSLGESSKRLSETLAPNISLNLTAELNYLVMCKGYPYFQIWEYPEFYDYICLTDCDFEIRPVWCFKPVGQCYLKNSIAVERYYVDAVTGEVITIVNDRYQKGNDIDMNSGW